MYVMYVCMYVCMYICMHLRYKYVDIPVRYNLFLSMENCAIVAFIISMSALHMFASFHSTPWAYVFIYKTIKVNNIFGAYIDILIATFGHIGHMTILGKFLKSYVFSLKWDKYLGKANSLIASKLVPRQLDPCRYLFKDECINEQWEIIFYKFMHIYMCVYIITLSKTYLQM
jgi:hypothetical protein